MELNAWTLSISPSFGEAPDARFIRSYTWSQTGQTAKQTNCKTSSLHSAFCLPFAFHCINTMLRINAHACHRPMQQYLALARRSLATGTTATAGTKRPAASSAAAAAAAPAPAPPKPPPGGHLFIKAGLPLILFSVGASYVLKDAIEGKNKERDAVKGASSKSERQARMEREQEDMMEKINRNMAKDFDNTRRIERPEEILERRKMERERRNRWYRRAWRFVTRQQ